jgi:hypothetical protein
MENFGGVVFLVFSPILLREDSRKDGVLVFSPILLREDSRKDGVLSDILCAPGELFGGEIAQRAVRVIGVVVAPSRCGLDACVGQ